MHSTEQERQAFSERLKLALSGIGWTRVSYTRLAQEFNRRAGADSVTVHGARKWVMGESIPAQKRLSVLASWLEVRPQWLRFGVSGAMDNESVLRSPQLEILADFASLDSANKKLAQEMVTLLLREMGGIEKRSSLWWEKKSPI